MDTLTKLPYGIAAYICNDLHSLFFTLSRSKFKHDCPHIHPDHNKLLIQWYDTFWNLAPWINRGERGIVWLIALATICDVSCTALHILLCFLFACVTALYCSVLTIGVYLTCGVAKLPDIMLLPAKYYMQFTGKIHLKFSQFPFECISVFLPIFLLTQQDDAVGGS